MTLRRIAGALAAPVATVVALALPAPAAALSCELPAPGAPDPPSPLEAADVAFDGIVLSGRSDYFGAADSPARVLVTRYLKGGGPRIRRVRTGVNVGPLLVGVIGGDFAPHIGDAVRVYGTRQRPGRDFGLPPGTLFAGGCDGSGSGSADRLLDRVAGSFVRATAASAGATPWSAFAQRGPRGLRCLRARQAVRRGPSTSLADCRMPRTRSALVVVGARPSFDPLSSETVVAAWSPDLERVEVEAPGQPTRVLTGPTALTVFAGRYDDYEIRLRLTFADGRVRYSHGDAPRRAFAPDPAGDTTWWALSDDSDGRSCVAADRVPDRGPDPVRLVFGAYACGNTRARGYFLSTRQVEQEARAEGERATPFRTIVLGQVEAGVRALAVTGSDGVSRELAFARRGGAVLAVLPAGVRARDLTVTATYADGLVERRPLR